MIMNKANLELEPTVKALEGFPDVIDKVALLCQAIASGDHSQNPAMLERLLDACHECSSNYYKDKFDYIIETLAWAKRRNEEVK